MRSQITLIVLSLLAAPVHADLDSLRDEAAIASAAGEADIAIEKLRQILKRVPDDGASHYQIATLLMDNEGDQFEAIEHFEQARQLEFQPMGVAYRLSRIFARSGRKSDALDEMETLASGGFGLLGYLEDESDYDSIRDDERFIAALETIRVSRFPCLADDKRHAFDFWIGEWTVTSNGQFAGTNSIQPILGHCTLFEQWESAAGTFGKSFNYFDPGKNHWRQIWIDDTGTVIEFTGEARDGGIFFTAETSDPEDGSITLHKFEFTQIENGAVRQYWETSADGGDSWTAIWDGRYEKRIE